MVIASNNKTSVMLGLLVCALGISVSFPADARKASRPGTYVEQGYPNPTPGITVMPRNTPKANIVCWTPCGRPGAIVMGALRGMTVMPGVGFGYPCSTYVPCLFAFRASAEEETEMPRAQTSSPSMIDILLLLAMTMEFLHRFLS